MDNQTILLSLRVTARVSFAFFLCAFAGAALARLWPGEFTRWFDDKKRAWILSFATSHTVHLAFIILLARNLGGAQFVHNLGWHGIILGGSGLALLYALALAAAFPNSMKPLQSPRFQAFAYYWIWIIFAFVFGGSVLKAWFYPLLTLAAVAALAVRVIAARQARKGQALAAASS
jgi:methionine sulfoxide reductase heme-binding subunit